MGSANESVYVQGDQPAETAYRQAVEQAQHEDGHSGYSGTIATSGGMRVVQSTPVSMTEAHKLEDERLENLSKWETWEGVAIATKDSFVKRTIAKTIRLDVPKVPYHNELIPLVTPLLGLKTGEFVTDLKVTANTPAWRTKITTPEGDRRIVYVLDKGDAGPDEEFPTLALARARAKEIADHWGEPTPNWKGDLVIHPRTADALRLTVIGRVDRGWHHYESEPDWDGRRWPKQDVIPMLVVETECKSRKVTVEAQVQKYKDGPRKLAGWYFYGWAAM